MIRDQRNSRARHPERAGRQVRRHAARGDRPLARRRRGARAAVRHDRQPPGLEGSAVPALPRRRRGHRRRAGRYPVRLGQGEAGPRPVRHRRDRRRRGHARRGDPGVRRAARAGRQRGVLPAGHPLQMGAGRRGPYRPVQHAYDRRGLWRAARPHHPRPHDARRPRRRRAVRCRVAAVRRSGRPAAPPVRRARPGAGRPVGGDRRAGLPVRHRHRPRGARRAGRQHGDRGARDRRRWT